jgi:hypothetical protein
MAILKIGDSILAFLLERPVPRLAFPSYFRAISFRCDASKVSGVTIVATWDRTRPAKPLRFRGQPTALVISETKSATSQRGQ